MTTEGMPKLVLTDPTRPDFRELESATKDLLLDADNSLAFREPTQGSWEEADSVERQADYVLDCAVSGEEDSRYVITRIGDRGVQAAMMSFRHNVNIPDQFDIADAGPAMLVSGRFNGFHAIDFFSFEIGPLHMQGVETLAGDDTVQEFISTMRHPALAELNKEDSLQAIRCAPVAIALMRAASDARFYAERFFVARKADDFVDSIPEDYPGREQMIAGMTSLKARLFDGLE